MVKNCFRPPWLLGTDPLSSNTGVPKTHIDTEDGPPSTASPGGREAVGFVSRVFSQLLHRKESPVGAVILLS